MVNKGDYFCLMCMQADYPAEHNGAWYVVLEDNQIEIRDGKACLL